MEPVLTLLGTGTPAPLTHRAGSSYLVEWDDQKLLFDCGPGAVRRLLKAGVNPAQVDALFLTHLHYDHCIDYAYLNLLRWDQGCGQIPELKVWGPAPLRRMSHSLLGKDGAFGPDLEARTAHPGSHFIYEARGGQMPRHKPAPEITEVAADATVEGGDWRVQVAEVIHVQPQLACLAYRLQTPTHTLVFGGDTAPTPALTRLAQGADVLLHMCHFLNGVVIDARLTSCCSGHLDAARTAKEAGVGTLVLVHITEQLERPGIRERVLYEIGCVFDGHVVFGEDLLRVPLGAVTPEPIR